MTADKSFVANLFRGKFFLFISIFQVFQFFIYSEDSENCTPEIEFVTLALDPTVVLQDSFKAPNDFGIISYTFSTLPYNYITVGQDSSKTINAK